MTDMSARSLRRVLIWSLAAVLIVAVGAGAVALVGGVPTQHVAGAPAPELPPGDSEVPMVKVIHPRQDQSLQVTVHQLATVMAFYQSDLRARVSGLVRSVTKDINDPVRAGELLLDIDAADLDSDVAAKLSAIAQRRQEKRVSQAKLAFAEAERDVAQATVKQRAAEIGQYDAMADSKRKQLARFQAMAKRDAIQPERVEEAERDSLSAESAVHAAKAAVEKANADLKEKLAGVDAARADVELRGTMIEVARQEYERSLALAQFARISAPFDGVVLWRRVDPGSFVQNASTGQSETLITVARTDLVTIVADFPDNAAPFIRAGLPATIELDDLPDIAIRARVTRYSPAVRPSDRTMRVEVDLFNGDADEFAPFAARSVMAHLAPLASGDALSAMTLAAAGRQSLPGPRKSPRDPVPSPAFVAGHAGSRLLPGLKGTMRLELSRPGNSSVIPSTAIYTRGGKPYLLVVRDGQSKQLSIRIHVNDGTLAKVSVIERQRDAGGSREVLRELSPQEEVLAARQLEVGPGARVRTVVEEW
jgi:multidrug resistance efflux pump